MELYAHIERIELYGYGSTTFKKEAKQRRAEPDECYLVGRVRADDDGPLARVDQDALENGSLRAAVAPGQVEARPSGTNAPATDGGVSPPMP